MKDFQNLIDVTKHFSDEKVCRTHLEHLRWKNGIACPHCGSMRIYRFTDGKLFKCGDCRKKFTVTVGTIFEKSKIPLSKWFVAIYLLSSHKKGISSLQLAKDISVTKKTSWFMLHRIRESVRQKAPIMLSGIVEIDETYIGGKISNKHARQRFAIKNKNSPMLKAPVVGMIERDGRVVTQAVTTVNRETLLPLIKSYLAVDTTVMTDSSHVYTPLKENYTHHIIMHEQGEYAYGDIHTNYIEGFWSLLKRGIFGIYHQVSPKHLQRYCDEFSFRYCTRKQKEIERFNNTISNCEGRLTFKRLIQKSATLEA